MLSIEPKEVFDWFYALNQIPRESGKEEAVSNFLVAFAKERGLEVSQDEQWNVIIRKPASAGYEQAEPVIIQGHMDMVCVKTEDSDHDFSQDPIEMEVKGNILSAKKTTLGADDGIAVAMQLALLDGDYAHPALEILVTTNEETTMAGAAAIQAGQLKGTRLLNIDGEEEGVFLTSCAGGTVVTSQFPLKKTNQSHKGYRLIIDGLKGGHSGMEIHHNRANANLLLFEVLRAIHHETPVQLAFLEGGTRDNVIPSRARCDFYVEDFQGVTEILATCQSAFQERFAATDPELQIRLDEVELSALYHPDMTDQLLSFFDQLPNGVQVFSPNIDGLVQTSLNNAVLFETDTDLVLQTSLRSSASNELEDLAETLARLAEDHGAQSRREHDYPSWDFEPESPLREQCLAVYQAIFGQEARYDAVHAGLECGFLKQALPDCDMISFGPNIYDVHSTKEHLEIDSVGRVWTFTKALLAGLDEGSIT